MKIVPHTKVRIKLVVFSLHFHKKSGTHIFLKLLFFLWNGIGNSIDANSADQVKKVQELNEQIKTYKAELADKQKEFQFEKQELQKVIEEQKDQIKKGGDSTNASNSAENEALNKELQKAKQEVKEAAVERERFQSQLEMLVQELEQKQVGYCLKNPFFQSLGAIHMWYPIFRAHF